MTWIIRGKKRQKENNKKCREFKSRNLPGREKVTYSIIQNSEKNSYLTGKIHFHDVTACSAKQSV